MQVRRSVFSLSGLLTTLMLGCGTNGPEIATVEGTVTLDSKPLPEASVLFINQNGRPAAAWTDESGKFRLMFDEGRSGESGCDVAVPDSRLRGWQTFSLEMPLPREAQSLVVMFAAVPPEDPSEASVHYLDDVHVSVLTSQLSSLQFCWQTGAPSVPCGHASPKRN